MQRKPYIGQLDRRIEIVKYSDTQSSTGAAIHEEEIVKTVWAQATFAGGDEEVDGQVISLNVRRYAMRYFSEIVTDGEKFYIHDLQDNGKYNIHHVEQVGRRDFVICKASSRE